MKVKQIEVSLELFQEWLTEGNEIHAYCIEGLPEGADFVGSHYDPRRRTVFLGFHHESFPEKEPGEWAPLITPRYIKWFPEDGSDPFAEQRAKEMSEILDEIIANSDDDLDSQV